MMRATPRVFRRLKYVFTRLPAYRSATDPPGSDVMDMVVVTGG